MAGNSSLPITTTQTDDTPQQSSAIHAFFSKISETVRSGLSNRRPWSELVDRSALSKPESVSDTTARIRKNYTYFNYLTIITAVLAVSLLTNPLSLVPLAAWLFLYLFRQSANPPVETDSADPIFQICIGGMIFSYLVALPEERRHLAHAQEHGGGH